MGAGVFEAAKEYGFKIPDFAKIPPQIDARECPKPFDTSVQSLNYSMAFEFLKELGIGWAAAKAAEWIQPAQVQVWRALRKIRNKILQRLKSDQRPRGSRRFARTRRG